MSNEPGQALREHPGACSTDPATRIGHHTGTELAEFDRYTDEMVGSALPKRSPTLPPKVSSMRGITIETES